MVGPSDTVRFRQETREIDAFRTISCGIGVLIPHAIVRSSRIFNFKKSPAVVPGSVAGTKVD
jgi:hypothetical protein